MRVEMLKGNNCGNAETYDILPFYELILSCIDLKLEKF